MDRQGPLGRSLEAVSRCVGTSVIAVFVVAAPSTAQPSPDGQLGGTVRDATGAVVVGASVTVESPSLVGGPRTVSTTEDGTWRAAAVPSGIYSVTIEKDGFRTGRRVGIGLVAGQMLTIDVTLDVAGVTETEQVEAPAPIVDVTSAAVPSHIGPDLLRDLPTARDVAQLINLVPGVNGDMAYGGTKMTNGIYVDGVDTTAPDEQGPWLRFNENWIQEVQVSSLGADADHGKFTGVNAYAIVRSGSNRYAGLGEYWTTRSDWVATNTRRLSETLQQGFASQRIAALWDVNGQVGGPVRVDRLWFFAGIERRTYNNAPAGYDGPLVTEEDETRALGKFTAAVVRGWRLEGFVQGGQWSTRHAGLGPLTLPEATSWRRQPQVSWSGRALGTSDGPVLLDLRYTGYDSPGIREPMPPGTADGPPGHYDLLTGRRSVNVLDFGRNDRHRYLLNATVSWVAGLGRAGLHQFEAGTEVESARERTSAAFPGGVVYYDMGTAPIQRDVFSGSVATGDTRHLALFVQDRWQVHRRLTLLPGLRVDAFRASTSRAAGVFETHAVSPRIGLAWSVSDGHRTVVRVHYGRYTDQVFAQPILVTDISGELVSERFDGSGAWQEISRRSLAGTRRIGTDLDQSRVDQVVVGVEHQVGRGMSVQAQYIHREFGDFLLYTVEGAEWTPVERRDPGPDGIVGTADDGGFFTVFSLTNPADVYELYTNPDEAWRRYDALQVVGRKRLSRGWQMQASYTWSRATGTIGNGFHANSGIRGTWGNPNQLINGAGRSPGDPTNEVKLLGSWRAPWLGGFTLGGVYRYTTGAAWGRTFVVTGVGQGRDTIHAEPRGTRRVDAINNLDLRMEKVVPLGGARWLGLVADVFNVTNQGVPDSDWAVPVFPSSGPSLGLPIAWRAARQWRLTVRLAF